MAKGKDSSFGSEMKKEVGKDVETSNTKMTKMAGRPHDGKKMAHEHFHDKMADEIGC